MSFMKLNFLTFLRTWWYFSPYETIIINIKFILFNVLLISYDLFRVLTKKLKKY